MSYAVTRFLISKLTKEQIVKNSLKGLGSFDALDAFKTGAETIVKTGAKATGSEVGSVVSSGVWDATKSLMGFGGKRRNMKYTMHNKPKNRNKRNINTKKYKKNKNTKKHIFQNFFGEVKNGHKKACPKSGSSKKFAEK